MRTGLEEEYDTLQRIHVALAYARAEYRLQPGDTVKLVVYRGAQVAPEYDQQITVQPDGKIFLVGIEKALPAQGLTMAELQASVTKDYAQIIGAGQVDAGRFFVSVQFLTSTKSEWIPDQVYLTGQVRRPGPVPYRRGFTVMQAISQAGGWLATANEDRVLLLRTTADGRTASRELDLGAVIGHSGDDRNSSRGMSSMSPTASSPAQRLDRPLDPGPDPDQPEQHPGPPPDLIQGQCVPIADTFLTLYRTAGARAVPRLHGSCASCNLG